MKVFNWLLVSTAFFSLSAYSAKEGMPGMPRIEPKRTHVVSSKAEGESIQEDRGFGDKEAEVKMMNLMMVEGSGMEGMDMSGMQMAAGGASSAAISHEDHEQGPKRYAIERKDTSGKAKVGVNLVEFTVRENKTGKPAKGLKIKAEVSMTIMDMGTETPRVKEVSSGKYQVKAAFSMKGPWAVKLTLPGGQKEILSFNAGSSK